MMDGGRDERGDGQGEGGKLDSAYQLLERERPDAD